MNLGAAAGSLLPQWQAGKESSHGAFSGKRRWKLHSGQAFSPHETSW
jgi:hypothetical protein